MRTLSSIFLRNALILSLALNIGLFAALVLRGKLPVRTLSSKLSPTREMTNESVIQLYQALEMPDLIIELKQNESIEEGITCGDIALGCLVAFHDFDIKRALGGALVEERTLVYRSKDEGRAKTLTIYPFLSAAQKNALFHFATSEQWPLKPCGLFKALKKCSSAPDSLIQAFYLTPNFQKLAELTGAPKDLLLSALLEGDWNDYSKLRFSIQHIGMGAALFQHLHGGYSVELFLRTSFDYAAKRLSDREVIEVLRMIRLPSERAALFSKQLLLSVRSEDVHYLSAALLAKIYNKPLEAPFDRYRAVEHFFPELLQQVSGTGSKADLLEKG